MTSVGLDAATLGGGCFWCLEATFEQIQGVESVVNGYAGGQVPHPTYKAVCTGATGHAEVVQVAFNPAVLPYSALLDIFFSIHDPTTLNRQGADMGTQYRSIILYHDEEQKAAAHATIKKLADGGVFGDPIVTQVEPLKEFYPAEDYHKGYYRNNPNQGYCRMVISPKVKKLRKEWAARLKTTV